MKLPDLSPRPADRRRIAQLAARHTPRRVRRREQRACAVPEELIDPRLEAASALCGWCARGHTAEPSRYGGELLWWHYDAEGQFSRITAPCRASEIWRDDETD